MLNMDPVVQVNVSVGGGAIAAGAFDVGALLTPETGTGTGVALSTTNRFASYSNLSEVLNGVDGVAPAFAASTETYKAAAKYFGASPAPAKLVVIFFDTSNGTDETPASALTDAIEKGADFYGLYYIPKTSETAANIKTYTVALISALESLNKGVVFVGTLGNGSTVTANDGLLKAVNGTGSKRGMVLACKGSSDDAPALMGSAMGNSRTHEDTSFALCYKSIPSATASGYTQSEIEAIQALNGNVYVSRTRNGAGLERGAVASGLRFDEVLYLDRIASDIQASIYSLIADNPNKLPQNDTTSTLFISEINRILDGYYNAGVLADAPWRGVPVGAINTGDTIERGYIAFADSFDNQSAADRAAHKAMPITILLCLSGSVESVVIYVNVQT